MRRTTALVAGLGLALGSTPPGATPPLPGGRVTIVIEWSEEGDAIAAELVRRMTTPFLVHPDGRRSTLTASPSGTSGRTWTIELPAALTSRQPRLALVLSDSLGTVAAREPWSGLTSCDPDTGLLPHRVVLRFARPPCNPLAPFGAWPAPPILEPGFRSTAERRGTYLRNPEADLWQPRLEEITLARSRVLDPPGPGEITVGAMPSFPNGSPNGHPPVSVAYRLTPISGAWPDSVLTRVRTVLPRRSFEPLVPPSARVPPDLGARGDSASIAEPPIPPIEVVHLVGTSGKTSDRLRGRARTLLARRGITLREDMPLDADTPVLRLDSVVRLGHDPVTDLRLYGSGDPAAEDRGWIVLEIRVAVRRGRDVVGDIGSPDLLWRRSRGEESP